MTEKSSQEDGISRREFVVATGAAAVVGSALAATGTPASAAAPSNEICRMDAVTLAEKIRTKQLSATEVTEAVLGRLDKLNPVLGAFCTPSPDVARAQAKAIEADIMAGKTVGPLAGVPVGIAGVEFIDENGGGTGCGSGSRKKARAGSNCKRRLSLGDVTSFAWVMPSYSNNAIATAGASVSFTH